MAKAESVPAFGENLRNLVEHRGLTHAQFAQEIGVSRATLSNYVNGNTEPGLATLVFMSRKLGTTPNHLLGVNTPEHTPSDAEKEKISRGIYESFERPDLPGSERPQSPEQRLTMLEQNGQKLHSIVVRLQARVEKLESTNPPADS